MIRFILAAILFLNTIYLIAQELTLESVDQLRWNSRIILVKVDSDDQITLSTLEKANDAINERHINWFVFSGNSFYSNYEDRIGRNFQANTLADYFKEDKNVLLLGKDGGVKLVADNLQLDEIFELIDSMPMRQMEMTTQSN